MSARQPQPTGDEAEATDRAPAWVFALALFVRLVYLWESSDTPSFLVPLVDSEVYDQAARSIAQGAGLEAGSFYQPLFYPLFLSAVYAVGGGSILVAKLTGALLGAGTAALACVLGTRVFDRRVGVASGIACALYGPLIFFDCELLATGWAAFWAALLTWGFVRARDVSRTRDDVLLGVASGLATLTRPTFLPFVVAATLLTAWRERRAHGGDAARRRVGRIGAGLAGVLLAAAALAASSSGHFGFLPSSAGLNLHLGNNPDPCETLTLRPGRAWNALVDAPYREGARDTWEANAYFHARFRRYVRDEPLGYLAGLGRKLVHFASSREIPRNLDVYLFRRWSTVLAITLGKLGPWGLPFGLVAPLAALGFVLHRRKIPLAVWLFVGCYALAVALVFTSARYRVPVVPVLIVVAAAGLFGLVDALRARRLATLAAPVAAAVATLVLGFWPGPFCQERPDFETEYVFLLGAAHQRTGELDEAKRHYLRALERDPDRFETHAQLGELYLERRELAPAVEHLERAVADFAQDGQVWSKLGEAYGRSGRIPEATTALERATTLAGHDASTFANLGAAYAQEGRFAEAARAFETALRMDPGNAAVRANLARLRREQRR